jgi:hypothetical protein
MTELAIEGNEDRIGRVCLVDERRRKHPVPLTAEQRGRIVFWLVCWRREETTSMPKA